MEKPPHAGCWGGTWFMLVILSALCVVRAVSLGDLCGGSSVAAERLLLLNSEGAGLLGLGGWSYSAYQLVRI